MSETSITKKQLISSIIFNGGNSFIFICLLKEIYLNPGILKFLTYLSYFANSFFLLFCVICDIFIYLTDDDNSNQISNNYVMIESENKEKEKPWFIKLNDWNRNKYGLVCNPFSYFVTISFWILFFLGNSYIKVSSGFYPMTRTFYFHLIITIIIIIDIFVSKRKYISKTYDQKNIVSNLFLIYCIFICIMKYYFKIQPYAFLNSSLLFLICYMLLSFILLYFCFQLNVWLINYVNKNNDVLY